MVVNIYGVHCTASMQYLEICFYYVLHLLYSVLDSDFLDGLFLSFADLSYLRDRSSVIREFASELRDHLTIDRERDTREGREFRVRDLLERLVERVKEDAAEEYGTVVQDIKMCIRDLIQVLVMQFHTLFYIIDLCSMLTSKSLLLSTTCFV